MSPSVAGAGVAVIALDASLRVTLLDPLAEQLTGWSQAEAIGKPLDQLFDLLEPESGHPLGDPAGSALATGSISLLTRALLVSRKDGRRRSVSERALPTFNPQGEADGAVLQIEEQRSGTVSDSYVQLAHREQLMKEVLDALLAEIVVLDASGTIIATNAAWRQFAVRNGLPWQQVSEGTNYLDVAGRAAGAGSEEGQAAATGIRDVLAGHTTVFTLEYPCHSPVEQRWFFLRVTRFFDDGVPCAVVSHQDVTTRRLAEAEQALAQRRFRKLFDSAPDATVLVNAAGVIELFNERAQQMFGYRTEEVLWQPVDLLLPPAHRDAYIQRMLEYLRNPCPMTMSERGAWLTGMRRDGSEFPIEVSLSPTESSTGLAVVAAIRDVSERVAIEGRLQQAQKMETIGRLAGGIAHDFNNLLSVINATAELAMADASGSVAGREDLETILLAGQKAAALTQQLLAFGRRQVVQPAAVDLNDLVSRNVRLLRRLLSENIAIVVKPGLDLKPVLVDPGQMEQVLLNLAANAGDAMPAGGTLTIETHTVSGSDMNLSGSLLLAPLVCLSVTDTGVGMDERVRERVFEPFFTTKEMGRGTGLGLATVYGIVKQAGGDIRCVSETGRGSTFRVLLPVTDTVVEEADAVVEGAVRGRETVLVIEDDAALRATAMRILEGCGYTVLAAADGEQALEVIAGYEGEVDLVLSDVVMPVMNGPAAVETIQIVRPAIKVLFTSGFTDNALDACGVVGRDVQFIAKPYSVVSLSQKVRAVLDL